MPNNLTPWIVIAGVVLVTLWYKGYLNFSMPIRPTMVNPLPGAAVALQPAPGRDVSAELSQYSSYQLSIALTNAVRREAEQTVAYQSAKDVVTSLTGRFTNPFSEAPPAGPSPSGPASGPSPPA